MNVLIDAVLYISLLCLLSLQHPGMLLSSYHGLESVGSDPDGVVLVWNLKFNKDTPDYVFNCHVSKKNSCVAKSRNLI